jgi:hypothetical protein
LERYQVRNECMSALTLQLRKLSRGASILSLAQSGHVLAKEGTAIRTLFDVPWCLHPIGSLVNSFSRRGIFQSVC